jgi:hypothetical protein
MDYGQYTMKPAACKSHRENKPAIPVCYAVSGGGSKKTQREKSEPSEDGSPFCFRCDQISTLPDVM